MPRRWHLLFCSFGRKGNDGHANRSTSLLLGGGCCNRDYVPTRIKSVFLCVGGQVSILLKLLLTTDAPMMFQQSEKIDPSRIANLL